MQTKSTQFTVFFMLSNFFGNDFFMYLQSLNWIEEKNLKFHCIEFHKNWMSNENEIAVERFGGEQVACC